MDLERFDMDTWYMIVFEVIFYEFPIGWKGEKNAPVPDRNWLGKALEKQEKGFTRIRNYAKVCRRFAL